MIRIYADADNNPADYEDNVPYTPRRHLNISMDGVEQGGFTISWDILVAPTAS